MAQQERELPSSPVISFEGYEQVVELWQRRDVKGLLSGDIPATRQDLLDLRTYALGLSAVAIDHLQKKETRKALGEVGLRTYQEGHEANTKIVIAPKKSDGYPYITLEHHYNPVDVANGMKTLSNQDPVHSWCRVEFENYPVGYALSTSNLGVGYDTGVLYAGRIGAPHTDAIRELPMSHDLVDPTLHLIDLWQSMTGDAWEFAYKIAKITEKGLDDPYVQKVQFERGIDYRVMKLKEPLGVEKVIFPG